MESHTDLYRRTAGVLVVPLTADVLVSDRLKNLSRITQHGYSSAPLQSRGLAHLLLRDSRFPIPEDDDSGTAGYGGIPEVAKAGYDLQAGRVQAKQGFTDGLVRLRERPDSMLREEFAADDIATLGVAAGIRAVGVSSDIDWFLGICRSNASPTWSARARDLAHELLRPEGRLRAMPTLEETREVPFELVLRDSWPSAFVGAPAIPVSVRRESAQLLITDDLPHTGEFDRAVVSLRGLEILVGELVREIVPSIDETVRLLQKTATSFARWVWEESRQRAGVGPIRWLIDRESHVQGLLWAILRPIYGHDLIDEEHLPSYGLKQAKADFGILSLKLLIEVKYLRRNGDLKKVEDEVAADLGSYFQVSDRFDRLLIYVYDDRDEPQIEKNEMLKQALVRRDSRIVDVVFVRRPSMMPPRGERTAVRS